jgi:hypothetical protein
MIKVHYMHIWEYHNETFPFVQLIYANKVLLISILVRLTLLLLGCSETVHHGGRIWHRKVLTS